MTDYIVPIKALNTRIRYLEDKMSEYDYLKNVSNVVDAAIVFCEVISDQQFDASSSMLFAISNLSHAVKEFREINSNVAKMVAEINQLRAEIAQRRSEKQHA